MNHIAYLNKIEMETLEIIECVPYKYMSIVESIIEIFFQANIKDYSFLDLHIHNYCKQNKFISKFHMLGETGCQFDIKITDDALEGFTYIIDNYEKVYRVYFKIPELIEERQVKTRCISDIFFYENEKLQKKGK